MTPTEKGRRVDALNQGPDTRRVLCDMIANRESDLEELRAENAKLREERREYQATIDSLVDECADHKAENDRLRELVRDMWRDGMCECDERGACAECEYHFPDRMRDLGVEVSE